MTEWFLLVLVIWGSFGQSLGRTGKVSGLSRVRERRFLWESILGESSLRSVLLCRLSNLLFHGLTEESLLDLTGFRCSHTDLMCRILQPYSTAFFTDQVLILWLRLGPCGLRHNLVLVRSFLIVRSIDDQTFGFDNGSVSWVLFWVGCGCFERVKTCLQLIMTLFRNLCCPLRQLVCVCFTFDIFMLRSALLTGLSKALILA